MIKPLGQSIFDIVKNRLSPLPDNFMKLKKKELRKLYLHEREKLIDLRIEKENEIRRIDDQLQKQFAENEELREALDRRRQALENALNSLQPKSIEDMASEIHNVWSKWYLHQKNNSTPENIQRWDRQSKTAFKDLSEDERDKDIKILMQVIS